jgi:flavin-dependent thymidylate synthase
MALVVRLAGYNVDADLLKDVQDLLQHLERFSADGSGSLSQDDCKQILEIVSDKLRNSMSLESFTPETISAAYARISRDPKQVTELRRAARFGVARARKSNENIIFGLGHSSVAEHACFNFDVLGLSRLASEELQSHRLLSFTEKSQRYITISSSFVIPPELIGTEWEARFNATVPPLFEAYQEISNQLERLYIESAAKTLSDIEVRDLATRAKEDARYLLPLCCTTQMGVTMNARNVEHVVRDLSDHPLAELRDLGQKLYDSVHHLAPSLIKYVARGSYPRLNRRNLVQGFGSPGDFQISSGNIDQPKARLLDFSPNGEQRILEALAFSLGKSLPSDSTAELWKDIFRNMGEHDSVPREFELATMTFDATISASCFAQLKRHRMMTLLRSPYRVQDASVIPPSVTTAGLKDPFTNALISAQRIAEELSKEHERLAPYLLTNAQTLRVRIQANARELYHFARLRCDSHAQWEIRSLADQMLAEARRVWPNLFTLACGKDTFAETYQKYFG